METLKPWFVRIVRDGYQDGNKITHFSVVEAKFHYLTPKGCIVTDHSREIGEFWPHEVACCRLEWTLFGGVDV